MKVIPWLDRNAGSWRLAAYMLLLLTITYLLQFILWGDFLKWAAVALAFLWFFWFLTTKAEEGDSDGNMYFLLLFSGLLVLTSGSAMAS